VQQEGFLLAIAQIAVTLAGFSGLVVAIRGTAGLLAKQTPEALRAIRASIEAAVQKYARGGGFAIPKAAYIVAVQKR
jgi:hypothetical protein